MMPQPCAVDNSVAASIHALTRQSKRDSGVGEVDDLVNEHCMAHRKGIARNDHAPEIPHEHRQRGGARAPDTAY